MHYEDIKLKQSTYAIISFNDWDRLGRVELAVWYPGGLPQGCGRGGGVLQGWQQPLWIYVSLSLLCPDLPRSHFIKGINFSNVHNCEP